MTRFHEKEDRHQKYDHKVFSRAWEGKTWKLIVGVYAFKGGRPRLQITREKTSVKYRNRPYAKLGRMSREEIEGVLPILQEALLHMK